LGTFKILLDVEDCGKLRDLVMSAFLALLSDDRKLLPVNAVPNTQEMDV
jgi:hypothetical protein